MIRPELTWIVESDLNVNVDDDNFLERVVARRSEGFFVLWMLTGDGKEWEGCESREGTIETGGIAAAGENRGFRNRKEVVVGVSGLELSGR